jgi:hypothetical protein
MKPYAQCFRIGLTIAVFSQIAISQQQTGTIIVFRLSSDHAIVASDSRRVRMCPPHNKIVSEEQCKILTFDNKYVFATSGYDARFEPCASNRTVWNINEVTKGLYRDGNISSVDDFARKWRGKMADVLTQDSKISPLPRHGHGGLVLGALFVGNSDHKMTAEMVIFQMADKGLQSSLLILPPDKEFQDIGEGEVLTEFDADKTARAKVWHHRIDKLDLDAQIAALAKLARDNDTSGGIGGKIDSIRITPCGINWLSVKKQCDNK